MKTFKIKLSDFVKPLKKRNVMYGNFKLNGISGYVDLENHIITWGSIRIELQSSPSDFNGRRYYMLCERCFKRCIYLYTCIINGEIGAICGQCAGVYKRTTNRTKTDPTYYWEQAEKEIRKIDDSFYADDFLHLERHFPERPKYMRKEKYFKHYRRFIRYVEKGNKLWLSGVSKLF